MTVSAALVRHETAMSQGNPHSSKRFVPSGVDAQSWIGFEHRIQERRFKALIESINGAVARRDGVAARLALEEARELRPGAAELNPLAARVALLPTGTPSSASSAYTWYRGLSAVAMFVVGIGLVIGIESFRSGDHAEPGKLVASAASPSGAIAESVTPTPTPLAAPLVIENETTPAVSDATPAVESPIIRETAVDLTREEPVGTAGVSRGPSAAAASADVPNRATFRAPVPDLVEPPPPANREVPDDYVAASARRENRPGFAEAAPPAPSIAANVIPQPISITAPPVLPATTAAIAAPTVTPRSDNTRVTQVLNQYARAYGQLDPSAARAVWPSVDERALARAFASLESQDVNFDKCDIDIKGTQASASCSGTASYVGKVGSRQARTEPRQWNFELALHGDDWKIEKAQTVAR